MKNKIIITLLIIASSLTSNAQVGIGTNTPDASAKLDVTSTNKGFLPPRVTLTGTSDVTTIASPATGLMVYNTATAGTSPSNVTPGLYYYDGSKWQRIINQQPDATIEFDKATPTTSGVVFTPNTPASKDYVYVSTVDASQWTYNGTTYITYTAPASTAWNLAGGTIDAGSNKTGDIVRSGKVGIGTTTPNASAKLDVTSTNQGFLPPRVALTGTTDVSTIKNNAGTAITPAAGLLVYNTATAGTTPNEVSPGYYYWNGSVWVALTANGVTKKSAFVGRGVDVTLDNLKVRLSGTGNANLQVSTVTGSYTVTGSTSHVANGSGWGTIQGFTINTTPTSLGAGMNFNVEGMIDTWTIMDNNAKIGWRIQLIIGSGYANNLITIERIL